MPAQVTLQVQPRSVTGKGVRHLRTTGLIPANVFGGQRPSVAIQIQSRDLEHAFKTHGAASMFRLVGFSDGKERAALIRHVQRTPTTGTIQHVDFMHVEMHTPLRARIPLHIVGDAPAVRVYGAMLVHPLDAIEVEALPARLPTAIDVDVSALSDVGMSVLAGDLALPEGVRMLAAIDEVVATITALRSAASAAAESPSPAAVEPTAPAE